MEPEISSPCSQEPTIRASSLEMNYNCNLNPYFMKAILAIIYKIKRKPHAETTSSVCSFVCCLVAATKAFDEFV